MEVVVEPICFMLVMLGDKSLEGLKNWEIKTQRAIAWISGLI